MIRALLDWLLGPRCLAGCGERVYPKDLHDHMTRHGWEPR